MTAAVRPARGLPDDRARSRDAARTASDNLERNRRLIEAYDARDLDAVLHRFDPGIELESAFAVVEGGSYFGHGRLRRWHEVDPEPFFDLGDHTLVYYVMRAGVRQRC